MNLKMGTWDYIDTELPFNTTDRSLHMKDMGGKGWELVSVSSNPVTGCHVFFWKRPQSRDVNKRDHHARFVIDKPEELDRIPETRKLQHDGTPCPTAKKSNQVISQSNYKKFPEPQVVMVVKYRPKEGCFDIFRNELYSRDYPNVIARHMGFNKQNEFVCVSLMESIDAALDLEGVGISWLDSVDHLLVKYPNGSRTESFSGPVWGWYPEFKNLNKFRNGEKVLTVIVVKIKDDLVDKVKDIILQPSNSPSNLFTCIAQYKDKNDTYIYVGLDNLESRIGSGGYYLGGHSKPLTDLVIPEMSREFFSDAEDFVWFNPKYF
ncbi:hypothetical protein OA340_00775 [Paracoccaceae bacterium]|nr:hypothetical protein [Paracoccaceae bacterium]